MEINYSIFYVNGSQFDFFFYFGQVNLFNRISTPYGLFNAKISFICKNLIVIITMFSNVPWVFFKFVLLLFVNHLFAHNGTSLKLVDKFTYLGSSVSSTEKDIDTLLTKAWTAIDRLLIIWKSNLTDKMKRSFFQAAIVSILLHGCTTWTLTKSLEKKLDGNYTRMLQAILNKS